MLMPFDLWRCQKGANVGSGGWVNSWETEGDGQVLKAKSQMVAKGFSQSHGDDFYCLSDCSTNSNQDHLAGRC